MRYTILVNPCFTIFSMEEVEPMNAFQTLAQPFTVELVRGKKGPMCHIGLDEDSTFQTTGKGKIAFPLTAMNRAPILGLYQVAACQDRGNYYILRGKNIPYGPRTPELFLQYLKHSGSLEQYKKAPAEACVAKVIDLGANKGQILCIRHWRNNKEYTDPKKAYHTIWYTMNDEVFLSNRWQDLSPDIEADTENWTPIMEWLQA